MVPVSGIALGRSAALYDVAGPVSPVGTVKGTAWLYESAASTCSENASGVPQGTLEATVAANGVALLPSCPKFRSG